LGSSDDDSVSPIKFLRVKHWFKSPICFNYLYEHKNGLPFHIENFIKDEMSSDMIKQHHQLSHPVFKAKTRCSSYVCPGSSCHTYGQNVSTEYQCLYYIVSYYKNLLQVQKGLNSGMDPILPQAVDRGFCTPRRNLHLHTPHLLSSRT
jgi:hypothetical protein